MNTPGFGETVNEYERVKTLRGRKWGKDIMMLGGMWNEGRMKERKLEGRWEEI